MSIPQQDPESEAQRLLVFLHKCLEDRGAMANLRCALSEARRPRAWPLLGQVGGVGDICKETVAGLFAYHPTSADNGNLGTTCRSLHSSKSTFEGRFRRLLGCETRAEVCERLRPVILAAKAEGLPVNYERLYIDLRYWSGSVKARWAREFWTGTDHGPEGEE